MATSPALNTDNQFIKYTISITQNSQNPNNNSSNVSVSVRFYRTNTGYTTYGKGTIYCKINGVVYTAGVTAEQKITNAGIVLFNKALDITHNSDGTKTLTVSAWINHSRFSSVEQAFSTALTPISGASQPRINVDSVNFGSSITVYTDRASSNYSHHLYYSFNGSSEVGIASGITDSYTWTVPASLMNNIPNAVDATITLRLYTFNDDVNIGNKAVRFKANVPSSVVPVINSLTVEDADPDIIDKFSNYVQGKSRLNVNIEASGAYGSTIVSYESKLLDFVSKEDSFETDYILQSGSLNLITKITDSRGRTVQRNTSITVLPYSEPSIAEFRAYRINGAGEPDIDGVRIGVSAKYTISPVGSTTSPLNDRTYRLLYKKRSDSSFTEFDNGQASWNYDGSMNFLTAPVISADFAYVVKLEITDFFKTVSSEFNIETGFSLINFNESGRGIAFGKVSEKDSFEVNMPFEALKLIDIFSLNSGQSADILQRFYDHVKSLKGYFALSDNGEGIELHLLSNGSESGVVKFDPNGNLTSADNNIKRSHAGTIVKSVSNASFVNLFSDSEIDSMLNISGCNGSNTIISIANGDSSSATSGLQMVPLHSNGYWQAKFAANFNGNIRINYRIDRF